MSKSPFAFRRGTRNAYAVAHSCLDVPATPVIARGVVRFEGWALVGEKNPARVDLLFNESVSVPTHLGLSRPDVPTGLKQPGASASCGWSVTVDLTQFRPGSLQVQLILWDGSGARSTLDGRRYELVDDRTRWDWDPPEFLADISADLVRQISSHERMPTEDADVYFAVGRSALKAIRIAQISSGKSDFVSILDMPCGHGRVLRWLKAAYPNAELTACDLLTDGVDFCAETLGANPVYSNPLPEAELFSDQYDLIFVGSLLTHVDVHQWNHLISLWHTLLAPDGLLVVTTHGQLVAERMRAGHLYGYPASAVARSLRAYEHAGFAFIEEPPANIDYGITIARPDWTLSRLLRHSDFRVVLYAEALWDRHQDVAAVVKRPL